MALPLDVRDLLKAGTQLTKARREPVEVVIVVEAGADDDLVSALRSAFRPRTAAAQVSVVGTGEAAAPGMKPDAAVVVAGAGGAGATDAVRALRAKDVIVALVPSGSLSSELVMELPEEDLVHGAGTPALVSATGRLLAAHLDGKRLAFAYNFPAFRRQVAEEVVRNTSWQNTFIGVVAIIPGADMPLMTANQAKMVLQIGAAYGADIGPERLKELVGVVGGGFLFRAIARQALTAVPFLGWALKGGVAFAGTEAMGKAAIAYFEEGGDVATVMRRVQEQGRTRMERVSRKSKAIEPGRGSEPSK